MTLIMTLIMTLSLIIRVMELLCCCRRWRAAAAAAVQRWSCWCYVCTRESTRRCDHVVCLPSAGDRRRFVSYCDNDRATFCASCQTAQHLACRAASGSYCCRLSYQVPCRVLTCVILPCIKTVCRMWGHVWVHNWMTLQLFTLFICSSSVVWFSRFIALYCYRRVSSIFHGCWFSVNFWFISVLYRDGKVRRRCR